MKTAVRQWSLVVGRAQEIRLRINNFLPLPSGGNSVVYNGSSTTELLRTTNGKRQTASKGLTANFERLKFSA
jgi:hypothetical protein